MFSLWIIYCCSAFFPTWKRRDTLSWTFDFIFNVSLVVFYWTKYLIPTHLSMWRIHNNIWRTSDAARGRYTGFLCKKWIINILKNQTSPLSLCILACTSWPSNYVTSVYINSIKFLHRYISSSRMLRPFLYRRFKNDRKFWIFFPLATKPP